MYLKPVILAHLQERFFSVEDETYFVVKIHSAFDAVRGLLHVFAKPYFWMPSSGKESIPSYFKPILSDILHKVY
jgi:hypothetical protein